MITYRQGILNNGPHTLLLALNRMKYGSFVPVPFIFPNPSSKWLALGPFLGETFKNQI